MRVPETIALLGPDEYFDEVLSQESMSKWLVGQWRSGQISARDVAEGAKRSPPDPTDSLLTRLKKSNPQNAHRDLLRWVSTECRVKFPPTYEADIPTCEPNLNRQILTKVNSCLPHEWLHALAQDNAEQYMNISTETARRLEEWKGHVNYRGNGPIATMNIWGDTAPYHTSNDSVMLLLWGSESTAKRYWYCANVGAMANAH